MAQSLSKLYVHLVFSSKGRTETLPKTHLAKVHAYIAEILNENNCVAIRVGGTANHVHILMLMGRTVALSDIVRKVKSSSARWINNKNGLLNNFAWQDGFGAFSISQSHINAVSNYIDKQEEHHKIVTFKDEFRRLCHLYNIDIDEKYVWN